MNYVIILQGNYVGFVHLPTHPHFFFKKMVGYVDLKDILQNGL